MMTSWSFAVRMIDELARLLRSMEKHRYLREVDHRVHWTLDRALRDLPAFAPHAERFEKACAADPELRPGSRDPRLWRAATVEEVIALFTAFWAPGEEAEARKAALLAMFEEHELAIPTHEPFETDPETPPFPELLELNWVLKAVDELDADRHAGVLAALEGSSDEVHPSEPIFQEGPSFSLAEICDGAPMGILPDDFVLWSEGPYEYADYVFRGVSKAAKLEDPPVGLRDLDDDEDEEFG
jgi:hypothetical protein